MYSPTTFILAYRRGRIILLAGLWLSCFVSRGFCQEIGFAAKPQPSSAAESAPGGMVGYEIDFPAMGTLVSFKAYHSDPEVLKRAFLVAEQRVHALEAILTDYDPDSETSRLSSTAVAKPVKVSAPLWQTMVAADRWQRATHGAFDASLGALTKLWRKSRRSKRSPSTSEIEQALQQCGWQYVRLDSINQTVQFLRPDIQLDFGAIGKGFIVDQAFECLQQNQVSSALVNISGNMRAGDPPPDRAGWRVEIAPIEQGGEPLQMVSIANQAIATSGDLWQFTMIDGRRRSHILDPHTGLGVLGPLCATVIAASASDADAMATAACIMGFDRAQEVSRTCSGMELSIADKISTERVSVQSTPGFP